MENNNNLIAQKLIEEMKKPGRKCMYDMSSSAYKNNHKKQIIWTQIANSIGIDRIECQNLWKKLRRQHKAALRKSGARSGSERVDVKGLSHFLLTEMSYFQNFWVDKECPATNYSDSNTESFRNILDEMANDPEVNDAILDDAEKKYKESLRTINNLATEVIKSNSEKRDPFFLALEDEFVKVPENLKGSLKVKLLSLIIDHQRN